MTGSTAARRFICRLILSVTPRFWPVVKTRNLWASGALWPLYPASARTRLIRAGQRLDVGQHGFERVAVIGPSGQRLGVDGELAAFAAVQRGGDGGLDAELVRPVRLAFADAFDLRRVQGIDMPSAVARLLGQNTVGLVKLGGKLVLQEAVAGDLAGDVADGAAKKGSERPQLGFGAVECLACA